MHRRGQRADRERLGQPGNALEQQMPVREHPDHHAVEQVILADDDLADLGEQRLDDRRLPLNPFLDFPYLTLVHCCFHSTFSHESSPGNGLTIGGPKRPGCFPDRAVPANASF